MNMTKTERAELKSVVRQRFKVLRRDVDSRRAELLAELQQHITGLYAAEDKAWADAEFLIKQAADEANRKANDILRGLGTLDMPEKADYELESDEAKAFLAGIPTVASLVPADRLLALTVDGAQ